MPYLLLTLALFLAAPSHSTPPDPPVQARWVGVSGDELLTVAGYTVVEYRNAGQGGLEWLVDGTGHTNGNGTSQLWLLTSPKQASTIFTAPSEAVAFMTAGDYNDGFATFLVDGVEVGTFDMYRRGEQTLVVEGLERVPHRLEVRATGLKALRSKAAHVALYGGAALSNQIVEHRRPVPSVFVAAAQPQ